MKIIGAYDKQNDNYIFPQNASKKSKYYCPDCGEDLIFKKGSIVIPHFSHKSNSKCTYYDHPNESQIHKDAKNKLAQWLKDKKPLKLKIKCSSCNGPCKNKKIKYKENDKVVIEYISSCKKYIADVAIINDDNVRYILEVTNTHRTIDNAAKVRPEPWFDINADEIVNTDFDKDKIKLNCIRDDCSRLCEDCFNKINNKNNQKSKSIELFKNESKNKEIEISWECIKCNQGPVYEGICILPDYNIIYNYKFKNINIDIVIFDKEKIKYFIIFNENIIDKIPGYIKWFYFEPEQFIEQYKNYKDKEFFIPTCNKSNCGQYCSYSFCYVKERKWILKNFKTSHNFGICLVCNLKNEFFCVNGTDEEIMICNDCIINNCRDNINNLIYKMNTTFIYLNIPYEEKEAVKKLGAKYDENNKKWYILQKDQNIFSRWINNKFENKDIRIYLNNSFNEKDIVKKLGASFDSSCKLWYVNKDTKLRPFRKFLNNNQLIETTYTNKENTDISKYYNGIFNKKNNYWYIPNYKYDYFENEKCNYKNCFIPKSGIKFCAYHKCKKIDCNEEIYENNLCLGHVNKLNRSQKFLLSKDEFKENLRALDIL